MMGYIGRASLGHARAMAAVLLLALISAVFFVLSVYDGRSASAQTSPGVVARAWGINSFGQLGDDSTAPRSKQVPVDKAPGPLNDFLTDVTSMEGGQNHSLALESDGTVYAWGHNGSGQLGNGPCDPDPCADSDTPVQVSGLTDVLDAAAGSNHSLALKSDGTDDGVENDGTVWAWGDNFNGQLGNGTSGTGTNSDTPVQVKGEGGAGFLTDVVAVAAGSAHSLAVKSDGTVWAWGDNGFGQLGNGPCDPCTDSNVPVQVSGLTGVASVAGGGLHSLALKSDGTLYAWGYNGSGALGDGTSTSPRTTPVQVHGENNSGFLTGVTNVAAGGEHSLAIKDGTVYAWGLNNFRQLGDGTSVSQRNAPVQVKGKGGVGSLTDATELASGDFHSLAVADADTTAPETTITSAPSTNSNSNSATFEFSSSELDSTFECRLDNVPFSSCTSSKTYLGLSEGQHTFQVRTKDVAGNLDSTPASHTWTVDTTAPSLPTIDLDAGSDTGSSSTDNITKDDTLTFNGTAEANSTVELFEQLSGGTEQFTATVLPDASGNWTKELSGVTEDTHTYIARAKDTFGNSSGPSDAVTVTVDKTAPTLDTSNSNSVEPDSGAPAAPRLTNVWATFSESEGMDPATLEDPSTTFTLVRVNRNGSTKPVRAAVSCVDDPCQTVRLDPFPSKPKAKLSSRKVYKATITTAATDLAGNALDGEKSWTFNTGRR